MDSVSIIYAISIVCMITIGKQQFLHACSITFPRNVAHRGSYAMIAGVLACLLRHEVVNRTVSDPCE